MNLPPPPIPPFVPPPLAPPVFASSPLFAYPPPPPPRFAPKPNPLCRCGVTLCPTACSTTGDSEANSLVDCSPFKPYFGTNYAPNDQEIEQLRTLIAEQEEETAKVDQQIARLRQEIAQLCKQNSPRIALLKEAKNLLTPIRHLPNEILQEIFTQCLVTTTPTAGVSMHNDDAPMVLTRVCRSWRHLALNTPRLWSSFHVSVPVDPSTCTTLTQRRIAGIEEFLRRSGSRPLRINVYQDGLFSSAWPPHPSDGRAEASAEAMAAVAAALRTQAHRWQKLQLSVPYHCLQPFLHIPASEMPVLEGIAFYVNPLPSNVDLPSTTISESGFVKAPRLKTVTLLNLPPSETYLIYPLTWKQLTHLVLEGNQVHTSIDPYINLLKEVHQTIESLRFRVNLYPTFDSTTTVDSYLEANMGTIEFPRLRALFVQEQSSPCHIGRRIRCPELQVLEYHDGPKPRNITAFGPPHHFFGPPDSDSPAQEDGGLAAILSHSGALIKTLTFNPHLYSHEQVMRYLSSVPLLENLRMVQLSTCISRRRFSNPQDILNAFVTPNDDAVVPGGAILCPRLRTLRWGRYSSFSGHDLIRFLEKKQSGMLEDVAKLEKIAVQVKPLRTATKFYQKIYALMPAPNATLITAEQGLGTQSVRAGLYNIMLDSPWTSDYSGYL